MANEPLPSVFVWPWLAAASVSRATAEVVDDLASRAVGLESEQSRPEPEWTTPNSLALELSTMRLRDFSAGAAGAPTLICAPLALHGPVVADFAPGHSVVERLRCSAGGRLYVTDWRTASADMRLFSIDTYLAEINVALDEIGPPVNLVGVCQGGWMSLLYAARFPAKVRRLVLAGAPIDIAAGQSDLSRLAAAVPLESFRELVQFGGGRMMGHRLRELWTSPRPTGRDICALLERPAPADGRPHDLERRFREWDGWTLDLPGTYYLEVVQRLFKDNGIVAGRFVALGRRIDLRSVRVPLYLLAGRNDDLVAPNQLFAAARCVGTPREQIETEIEPCGHLGLFMGRKTVRRAWARIGRWLRDKTPAPPLAPAAPLAKPEFDVT